jgi:hypothetical protein
MLDSSVLTSRNTTRLHYKDQMVDDVQRNNDCLFLKSYQTHEYTV